MNKNKLNILFYMDKSKSNRKNELVLMDIIVGVGVK